MNIVKCIRNQYDKDNNDKKYYIIDRSNNTLIEKLQ